MKYNQWLMFANFSYAWYRTDLTGSFYWLLTACATVTRRLNYLMSQVTVDSKARQIHTILCTTVLSCFVPLVYYKNSVLRFKMEPHCLNGKLSQTSYFSLWFSSTLCSPTHRPLGPICSYTPASLGRFSPCKECWQCGSARPPCVPETSVPRFDSLPSLQSSWSKPWAASWACGWFGPASRAAPWDPDTGNSDGGRERERERLKWGQMASLWLPRLHYNVALQW